MRTGSAVYLRKSQMDIELEAIGEHETLARHRSILFNLAKKKGLNIVEVYEEIVSGESIQARPEMQRLLTDLYQKKYESVMVMEIERLARGATKDQGEVAEAFKFSDTKIVTPMKTYDPNNEFDEEYLEFNLFMSRREYKTIHRRMLAGKIQAIKEGNYLGSLPPYGYDIQKNGKRDRTLVFNDQTLYVKMIFDWFIDDRINPSEIARRLTAMGVPTRTGKKEWNRATIKDILTNDLYRGKIRWFRRKILRSYDVETKEQTKHRPNNEECLLADGKHQPIISDERFEYAQTFFKKSVPTKTSELINPFAGVFYCKKCGKAMVFHRYKNRPNVKDKFIHRAGYTCSMKPIAVDDFVNIVTNEIKSKIEDFKVEIEEYTRSNKQAEYEIKRETIELNLKKEKRKLDQIFEDREEGLYTKEKFIERKTIVENKITNLKKEFDSLVIPTTDEYEEKIADFSQLLDTIKDDSVSVIHRNMFIKSIIKRIDYSYNNGIELDIYFNS